MCNNFPWKNGLAYFSLLPVMKKKEFVRLTLGCDKRRREMWRGDGALSFFTYISTFLNVSEHFKHF
jgi:hypothetical protein